MNILNSKKKHYRPSPMSRNEIRRIYFAEKCSGSNKDPRE